MPITYLTIDELAAYLKVPKKTIYDWTYKKTIPYIRIGKYLRFDQNKIDKWLQANEVRPAA